MSKSTLENASGNSPKWNGRVWPGASGPTLGFLVAEWIEDYCVIPDGPQQGERYRLTLEMLLFLVRYYELRPDAVPDETKPSAAFRYRGALLMRPQKWGKGPFAAAICLAEAFGPVNFAGWDEKGEPIGTPRPTPWIQIVATSEEQTDNTWLALYEMASRGPVAALPGIDLGIQDLNLPGGGKIEPKTSSGNARLGARLTFAIFDESGLMVVSNGGVKLATTMKRNISGKGGRWLETTNSYDPSEKSIAQLTHESAASDVLIDYRPAPRQPDFDNDADCLELLAYVYGDSYWVDRERILADARDPAVCPSMADALRFFFNLITVGVSDVVDPLIWATLARTDNSLKPGDMIALGFDGSRSGDCTSLVASRVTDGRWFHLRTWNPSQYENGQISHAEVNEAVTAAFGAYDVRYIYADPYHWQTDIEQWEARYPKRVITFSTNKDTRIDAAIVRFLAAVKDGLTHDGDATLTQHIQDAALARGARKHSRPGEDISVIQHYLKIVKKRQTGHIDALIAGILAEEARGKAIEDGALMVSSGWGAL